MPSIYFLKEWILQLDTSVAIQLIILLILLILSGFFSSAETALTTVNRMRIRGLADEGNKKAKTVMHITDDTSKMLSAILIGNNVVNLSAASLTTTLAYNLGGSMVAVASAVLSVLIIIFGEITPKTMATPVSYTHLDVYKRQALMSRHPIMHVPILSIKFDATFLRNEAWKIDFPPCTSDITNISDTDPFSPPYT